MRVQAIKPPRRGFGAIGDVHYSRWVLRHVSKWLSSKYWSLPTPRRLPIVVVLPWHPSAWWCVDFQQSVAGKFTEPGWDVDVTRGLEHLTLGPSINVPGCWHGFIRDGEMTPA